MATISDSQPPIENVNYLQLFEQRYPKPEINFSNPNYEQSKKLIIDHCEHVLLASNEVRQNIDNHSWDNLTAEQVFQEIHWIHVGKDDPIKHIIATTDFGALESVAVFDVWSSYQNAAEHLGKDISYKKGAYRNTDIGWGERGRGILGVAPSDIERISRELFKVIDNKIAES